MRTRLAWMFALLALGCTSAVAAGDSVGICSFAGASPTRYEVLPASAVPDWYAAVHDSWGRVKDTYR